MSDTPILHLQRQASTDHGTPGRLYLPSHTFDTLELPDRHNHHKTSRIPAGTYHATFEQWLHHQPRYLLHDVYQRAGIFIHAGNFAGDILKGFTSDSEGCIILGIPARLITHNHLIQTAVVKSKKTTADFENIMQRLPFYLSIADPPIV